MKPIFFPAPIQHRNFALSREQFISLVKSSPGAKIIVLVGPTQSGKSVICGCLIDELRKSLRPAGPAIIPFIHIVAATSQDGRISPKHITLKILKALDHPIYMHIGEFDEGKYYAPSRGKDEGTMRTAVELAMAARETKFGIVDEAHHLTHTKDRNLSGNILDSIKCLTAIEQTLVLIGGYELVYRGVFDAAHFAGRMVILELAPYVETDESDYREWLSILKAFSKQLSLSPKDLLCTHASELLRATNGCFGLLEKLLWLARGFSAGKPINKAQLLAAFPAQQEHDAIRRDIAAGQKALVGYKEKGYVVSAPESAVGSKPTRSKKPFQRKANRTLMKTPKVVDDE